jgi:hypothetical protein
VANWCKLWVLFGKGIVRVKVALVWTDCVSEWLNCINGGFCVEKELRGFGSALLWTDCDIEFLIGINFGFYLEKQF